MAIEQSFKDGHISFRTVTPDDYDAIRRVWSLSGLRASTRGRESREAFLQQLQTFSDFFWVALSDDKIIGVVFGTHDQRKGWINRLAVMPQYQGRGIAQELISKCDDSLRSMGIEIVAALIEPDNEHSIAVFEKAGYLADVPVIYYRKRNHPDV